MIEAFRPHPENVPGPFYVINGCCTACDVPFVEAPGLFAYDQTNHCFVARQPKTKEQVTGMLGAAWAAEFKCIRYRGNDADVLRRFGELGEPDLCDIAPPDGIKPLVRNCVTFDAATSLAESISPGELANAFQEYLRSPNRDSSSYKFTPIAYNGETASFSYSWFEDSFYSIEFRKINLPECRWFVRHSSIEKIGSRSVSNQLDRWLRSDSRLCGIRWYTDEQWNSSKEWQETLR